MIMKLMKNQDDKEGKSETETEWNELENNKSKPEFFKISFDPAREDLFNPKYSEHFYKESNFHYY